MTDQPISLYEAMGGAEAIGRLVAAFYTRVAQHPDLIPIFPADLTSTQEKQYLFLTQFFGGPPLYSQAHGHPMLRARHLPHAITPQRAQAWLGCMAAALEEAAIPEPARSQVFARLQHTAAHMVNQPGP